MIYFFVVSQILPFICCPFTVALIDKISKENFCTIKGSHIFVYDYTYSKKSPICHGTPETRVIALPLMREANVVVCCYKYIPNCRRKGPIFRYLMILENRIDIYRICIGHRETIAVFKFPSQDQVE